ncbi:zinc metalloprotease, partial [Staphylococcus aureus]|nr:zinc metalloprotease [Staphylococcus aureus]
KYGKSYDDIRKEQLDEGDEKEKEDRKENRDIEHERRRQHNEDHDYKGQESDQDSDSDVTGHEQSPNIDKPYDPNNPDNRH